MKKLLLIVLYFNWFKYLKLFLSVKSWCKTFLSIIIFKVVPVFSETLPCCKSYRVNENENRQRWFNDVKYKISIECVTLTLELHYWKHKVVLNERKSNIATENENLDRYIKEPDKNSKFTKISPYEELIKHCKYIKESNSKLHITDTINCM